MPERAAFDHLIHWVDDLGAAMRAYEEHGLPTHEALTMPGFRNGAWGVDDVRYVELATVDDWDALRTSKYAESIALLKPVIDAHPGPHLVTFAVDVADARATAGRLRAAGRDVETVEVWFEDRNGGFVEVFVRDAPAWFPFFITYQPPREELGRMRAAHREAAGITLPAERPDLVALLVGSAAPEAEARLLGELLGCTVRGTVVDLPGAQVRFESDSPAGLFGFVVRGSSIDGAATIEGVQIVAEP